MQKTTGAHREGKRWWLNENGSVIEFDPLHFWTIKTAERFWVQKKSFLHFLFQTHRDLAFFLVGVRGHRKHEAT